MKPKKHFIQKSIMVHPDTFKLFREVKLKYQYEIAKKELSDNAFMNQILTVKKLELEIGDLGRIA